MPKKKIMPFKRPFENRNSQYHCKTFPEVPEESVFGRRIVSLKIKVKAGCLCKKVKQWFDETRGSGPDLQYRFTVKESDRFCRNYYMSLVNTLSDDNNTKADR